MANGGQQSEDRSVKHSRAPFHLENVNRSFQIYSADCRHVADLFPGGPSYNGASPTETAANAALLTAAPDLLSALISAVEGSGYSLAGPSDPRAAEHGEPAWVCTARAAIARATETV